ncbi:MAG: ankyrin repeat domain-containing protein [Tenuifilaceae bacterium]
MKKSILITIVLAYFLMVYQDVQAQNIFEAIKSGNLKTIKSMVAKDSQLMQSKDEVGNTPLHFAIASQKIDIVKFLIDKGSDVNITSNTGETPLHIAAKLRMNDIVLLLISKGAKIDINDGANYTPLTNAIHHHNSISQVSGKLETVKILVENGADINKKGMWGWFPIQVAAEFGPVEVVDYLIDKGAIIPTEQGQDSYQLLNASCTRGLDKLFEKLMEKGFDLQVNQYTRGLIHAAAAGGSEKIVEELLRKGFKVMVGDVYGWSPLHSAAEKGNLKVVELLVSLGADINDRNASGRTPYNLADYFGHKEVCDFFVSKGADKSDQKFPSLNGNYMGQKEPDNGTRVFAPDIVSTKYMLHGNIVFSPNGDEAYWSGSYPSINSIVEKGQILTSKLKNGYWTVPELASFSKVGFNDDSPFISPDGTKLFFLSKRPLKDGGENSEKENIWFVSKEGDNWSKPIPVDAVNSLRLHWQVSVDKNGNLYFGARDPEEKNSGEIFCSKFENGTYQKPLKLSSFINSQNSEGSPYISPNGDYLLFDRASNQGQQMGLFISFRKEDGSWTVAKPISDIAKINARSHCCNVTNDGKYLFYIFWYGNESASFWVKADFINEMRSKSSNPVQDVFEAIKTGNLDLLRVLIEKNSELLNAKDQNGTTPLHIASSGKQIEIQKFLLEKGADVNAQESDLSTPLHYAAVRNHKEGALLLIEKGADINALDNEKHTPLHLASQNGIMDIVTVLVKSGAKLELKDDYGRTPLLLGSRERGGADLIRILLEAGANINSIDNSGYNSLSLAAWRGKKAVVDVLLDHKTALPDNNNVLVTLVSSSVQKALVRLFRYIVDAGFDPKTIKTFLNDAAAGGSKEIVSDLISKGFKVNEIDINGWSPIHYAAYNGRFDAVSMLIEKGADINCRNLLGQTPFNIADEKGFITIKQILIDNKADQSPIKFPVLRGDYLGQTPPGKIPQIFAQGIISSVWGLHTTAIFSPDGNEVYWRPMIVKPNAAYSTGGPFVMKRVDGIWTPPQQPSPFNDEINDDVPFFSTDGKQLFILSTRPLPGEQQVRKENIWVMEKTTNGWSEMHPFDKTLNEHEMHWQFSIDRAGNVYIGSSAGGGRGMMDIYCSRFENGKYQTPVNLGAQINTDKNEMTPFIAPDGSYLLFQSNGDIFVSFLKKDGSWAKAFSLGSTINTESDELCPVVSPDGKYLFFNSTRSGENSAYWVDAKIIEELRPTGI